MNDYIQGKKIDFEEDLIEYGDYKNSQNIENINLNKNIAFPQSYNSKFYDNINNNNTSNNLINPSYISMKENNVIISNINVQPLNISINKSFATKVKCTCSKTGCLKKYCYCFSKGKPCDGCDCKNCENQPNKENINLLENDIENINYSNLQVPKPKSQRVICNCTKSNCMKKYCECFKQGLACNSLCRCLECKNEKCINPKNNLSKNNCNYTEKNTNLISNNNLCQVHDFSTSYFPETFCKSMDYNNPINYQPEAFGIFIKREKLRIDERKINLNSRTFNKNIINEVENRIYNNLNETPKYSNRKRARNKEDISNMRTCPTTNSSSRRRGLSSVNKNIQKKKLQLN